jgi:hypothetical protein
VGGDVTDAELITQAYEATVKALFGVFHTSRIAPGTKDPAAALREADQAFQRGIAAAKASRDRAFELLGGAGV